MEEAEAKTNGWMKTKMRAGRHHPYAYPYHSTVTYQTPAFESMWSPIFTIDRWFPSFERNSRMKTTPPTSIMSPTSFAGPLPAIQVQFVSMANVTSYPVPGYLFLF